MRQFNFLHEIDEESHPLFAVGQRSDLDLVEIAKFDTRRKKKKVHAAIADESEGEACDCNQCPATVGGPAFSAELSTPNLQRLLPPEITGFVIRESSGRVNFRSRAHF